MDVYQKHTPVVRTIILESLMNGKLADGIRTASQMVILDSISRCIESTLTDKYTLEILRKVPQDEVDKCVMDSFEDVMNYIGNGRLSDGFSAIIDRANRIGWQFALKCLTEDEVS